MPQNVNIFQTRPCISKDNCEYVTGNNRIGDVDRKNVTSSAASVSGFCPAGLHKSVNDPSTANGSFGDKFSADEGNKCSLGAHKYSSEAVLSTVDFSGSSAPSEASLPRDREIGIKVLASECSMEPVESSPAKLLNILGHVSSEEHGVSMNPEAGYCVGSPSATDSLKSQPVADNVATDELVDVRVCDICGDVGREALLALCSKCSDGAEHIYCMRIEMDRVPDGDWMCEECMDMQEPKRQKLAEGERTDRPSNPSYLEEVSRSFGKKIAGVQYADERRTEHFGKASCLSGKRPGSDIEEWQVPKKRILEGSVQPLKSSGCGGKALRPQGSAIKTMTKGKYEARQVSYFNGQSSKNVMEKACSPPGHRSPKVGSNGEVKPALKSGTLEKSIQLLNKSGSGGKMLLTRVSSLKIVDGDREAARRLSSFGHYSPRKVMKQYSPQGHQSPRFQQLFRGGKLCKSKSINIPASNKDVRLPSKDIHPHGSAQESADSLLSKKCPERKLLKSMSFNSVIPDANKEVQGQSKDIHSDASAKESADSLLNKKFPERKLLKSTSFNSVSSVPPNVSNGHFSHSKQDLRYGSGSNSTKKYDSARQRSPRLGLPFAASDGMKNTHNTKVGSENKPHSLRNNVQEMKAVEGNGNSNVKPCGPIACQGQNSANTSVGEAMSSSPSGPGISSPEKNVCSYPDQKANQSLQKSEIKCSSGSDKGNLVVSDKLLPTDLQPMKEMHPLTTAAVVSSGISAVPESEFIWKGTFKLERSCKLPNECSGIQAHLSTCASSKVVDLVHQFCPKLSLKEVARLDTWPIQFQRKLPTEQDIAVYFFAEDLESYSKSYKMVLEGMIKNDLALETDIDGVQLLVFASSLLPIRSQRWNALSYLWGVFRVRKVDNPIVHCSSLNVAHLYQGSLDPMVLQSSASIMSGDQFVKHEETQLEECLGSQETENDCCKADTSDDLTEKKILSGSGLCNDGEKEDRYTKQEGGSLSKPYNFPIEQLDGENMVYLAIDPDVNYKDSNLTWQEEKKPDVASGSSFSMDSGPSESSDCGGCGKPDEGQVEQSQSPASSHALNLDLSLRTGSETVGEIDLNLDLALGFPQTNKYQSKRFPKDSSNDGGNTLALSLGMPC